MTTHERQETSQHLFRALTSNRVSRNKYFGRFSDGWFKAVHRRYRVVLSLKTEARRLLGIPGSDCWVTEAEEGLMFHLRSPRLRYTRVVALAPYEWEWLTEQQEVRSLLQVQPRQAVTSG